MFPITIFALLVALLVLAVWGGIDWMLIRWYRCQRCGMFYNTLGTKTTVPPNRVDCRSICCEDCLEEGL